MKMGMRNFLPYLCSKLNRQHLVPSYCCLIVLMPFQQRFRILIDATTVTCQKDGLSQYIISLVANLPETAFETFEFIVLLNKNVHRADLTAAIADKKLATLVASIAPIGPRRDWDMFWFLKKHKHSFDLFHSTSNQYPLSLKNGIATIHDITFKKYFDTPWWSLGLARFYMNLVIKKSLKDSAAVIAVSQSTKNDLLAAYSYMPAIRSKINVIHEGWEHISSNGHAFKEKETAAPPSNYLFYAGSTRRHKNIFNLLKAFSKAAAAIPQVVNLVLCGSVKNLKKQEIELVNNINKTGEKVIFKGPVSEAELEKLYRHADAFIFPSLSEGFGIPILEAFSYQKPLLCSNTSSFPEIAGDAAIYFDPHDTGDIAEAIVYFYQHRGIVAGLAAKGAERLQHFSWKKMAAETVALYSTALQQHNNLILQTKQALSF
jgi:glycosyltransferase involved in cell wall biosynthesis